MKLRSGFAFKNAAFDAKCLHENESSPFMSACTRGTSLGTVLGTLAPFFVGPGRKWRRNAETTVYLTVAFSNESWGTASPVRSVAVRNLSNALC